MLIFYKIQLHRAHRYERTLFVGYRTDNNSDTTLQTHTFGALGRARNYKHIRETHITFCSLNIIYNIKWFSLVHTRVACGSLQCAAAAAAAAHNIHTAAHSQDAAQSCPRGMRMWLADQPYRRKGARATTPLHTYKLSTKPRRPLAAYSRYYEDAGSRLHRSLTRFAYRRRVQCARAHELAANSVASKSLSRTVCVNGTPAYYCKTFGPERTNNISFNVSRKCAIQSKFLAHLHAIRSTAFVGPNDCASTRLNELAHINIRVIEHFCLHIECTKFG